MAQQPPGGWEQLATKQDLAVIDAKMETGFTAADAKMETGFAEVKERFAELSDKRSRDVWAFITAITVMTVSICGSVFLSVWQLAPA